MQTCNPHFESATQTVHSAEVISNKSPPWQVRGAAAAWHAGMRPESPPHTTPVAKTVRAGVSGGGDKDANDAMHCDAQRQQVQVGGVKEKKRKRFSPGAAGAEVVTVAASPRLKDLTQGRRQGGCSSVKYSAGEFGMSGAALRVLCTSLCEREGLYIHACRCVDVLGRGYGLADMSSLSRLVSLFRKRTLQK